MAPHGAAHSAEVQDAVELLALIAGQDVEPETGTAPGASHARSRGTG